MRSVLEQTEEKGSVGVVKPPKQEEPHHICAGNMQKGFGCSVIRMSGSFLHSIYNLFTVFLHMFLHMSVRSLYMA